MIRFSCPSCQTALVAKDELAGGKVLCTACGRPLRVPRPGQTAVGNAEPPPGPAPTALYVPPGGVAPVFPAAEEEPPADPNVRDAPGPIVRVRRARPDRRLAIVGGSLAALAVLAVVLYFVLRGVPKKSDGGETDVRAAQAVSENALSRDYENEIEGDGKYLGKTLRFTNPVMTRKPWREHGRYYFGMSSLASGEPNIVCEVDAGHEGDFTSANWLRLSEIVVGEWSRLKPGYVLVGVCRGRRGSAVWPGYVVRLEKCRVVAP